MHRLVRGCLIVALAGAPVRAEPPPLSPAEVAGLAAWYKVDTLHKRMNDGDIVTGWPDDSGNARHIQSEKTGIVPIFRTQQLEGRPVVEVRKGDRFRVMKPFDLDDHTIFLVYRSQFPKRALFASDEDPGKGLVLGDTWRHHFYQNGDMEFLVPYNAPVAIGKDYQIATLARDAGLLASWIDGRAVSSGERLSDVIRVGSFFALKHTQFAYSDGEGLQLAEMAFFDRFLPPEERLGVLRHLSDKYEIEVDLAAPDPEPPAETVAEPAPEGPPAAPWTEASASAWLSSDSAVDLNRDIQAVVWTRETKLEEPFRHDERTPSRLYSTEDGNRARLRVELPLRAVQPGAALRVLFLKNGEDYLPDELPRSGVRGPDGATGVVLSLEADVKLDAGEWVEVVVVPAGKEGKVGWDEGASPYLAARSIP